MEINNKDRIAKFSSKFNFPSSYLTYFIKHHSNLTYQQSLVITIEHILPNFKISVSRIKKKHGLKTLKYLENVYRSILSFTRFSFPLVYNFSKLFSLLYCSSLDEHICNILRILIHCS